MNQQEFRVALDEYLVRLPNEEFSLLLLRQIDVEEMREYSISPGNSRIQFRNLADTYSIRVRHLDHVSDEFVGLRDASERLRNVAGPARIASFKSKSNKFIFFIDKKLIVCGFAAVNI